MRLRLYHFAPVPLLSALSLGACSRSNVAGGPDASTPISAPAALSASASSAPVPAPPVPRRHCPRAAAKSTAGHKVPPSGQAINDAALNAEGTRLATTGLDNTTLVWDVDTWTIAERLRGSPKLPSDKVAFRPDGGLLACGPGPYVYVRRFGPDTPQQWERFIDEPFRCTGLEVVPKAGIGAYSTGNGDIVLFDYDTGAIKSRHRMGGWWLTNLTFSAAGDRVAVIADRQLAVLDTATWKHLHVQGFPGNGLVRQLAFSADGATLGMANGSTGITMLSTSEFKPARELPFPIAGQVVFTPDGSRVVGATMTRGGKGHLRWWDTATWSEVRTQRLTSSPLRLLMTAEGNVLVAVNGGGSIRFFDSHDGELLATADASPWR